MSEKSHKLRPGFQVSGKGTVLPKGYTEPNLITMQHVRDNQSDVWPEGIHDLAEIVYRRNRHGLSLSIGELELAYRRGYQAGFEDAERVEADEQGG